MVDYYAIDLLIVAPWGAVTSYLTMDYANDLVNVAPQGISYFTVGYAYDTVNGAPRGISNFSVGYANASATWGNTAVHTFKSQVHLLYYLASLKVRAKDRFYTALHHTRPWMAYDHPPFAACCWNKSWISTVQDATIAAWSYTNNKEAYNGKPETNK